MVISANFENTPRYTHLRWSTIFAEKSHRLLDAVLNYAETCVDYGQVIKIREGEGIVDKIKKVIYGTPDIDEIETTDFEIMNGISRERQGRLVRETKCFSKLNQKLINYFEIF